MVEGTQIGAYRILQQIGAGGMGSVWLAEHTMLGRRAAIKVLHPSYSSQQEVVTRFFNEARAATSISDPGIVQIFDFGQHVDGSAYIVMELLAGETLHKRLERLGRIQVADALRILQQVATSLGAAHARNIVHRDLKPENIFLVPDAAVLGGERAKILDFGIAKLVGDGSLKTSTSAVMGTPMFMSPEQCRGAGLVDQRSDIYALGCVLFALLTGGPPFDAEGVGEIIAMHLREPAPAPSSRAPGIPVEVDQLVLRCLSKDPAQRYHSGADLASALSALLGSPMATAPFAAASGSFAGVATAQTTMSAASGIAAPTTTSSSRGIVFAGVGFAVAALAGVAIWFAVGRNDKQGDSPAAPTGASAAAINASPPTAAVTTATTAPAPAPAQAVASAPAVSPETPPLPPVTEVALDPDPPKRSAKPAPKVASKALDSKASATKPVEPKPASPEPATPTPAPPEPAAPKPAGAKPAAADPNRLSRDQISEGLLPARPQIRRCGTGFPGTTVNVSVVVAPSGEVTSVTVNESPDSWLSSCVSARVKAAKFPATPGGGAFRQGFRF